MKEQAGSNKVWISSAVKEMTLWHSRENALDTNQKLCKVHIS